MSRRKRVLVVSVGCGLLAVIPPGWAVWWAITARPVGIAPAAAPAIDGLPRDLAELVAISDRIRAMESESRDRVMSEFEACIWMDLDVLLKDDETVEEMYFSHPYGTRPDDGAQAAARTALRAEARTLRQSIEDAGMAEAIRAIAESADPTPIPIETAAPISAANSLRQLARTASTMALLAVRAGDADAAIDWFQVMRIASDGSDRLPDAIGWLSASAVRSLMWTSMRTAIGEARHLDPDTAGRVFGGIEETLAAMAPPVSGERWTADKRHRLEQWLGSISDPSGRLLPAWIGHEPPAAPPSAADRLRWNLPYLLHPRRAAVLARAEPLLARFTEPAAEGIAAEERQPAPWDPEPDDERDLAMAIDRALDSIVRSHRLMVWIRIGRETDIAGLRVAIAIERHRLEHGSSPRTLADLTLPSETFVDPWTGARLRYEPGDPAAGDRWRLWSAGRDGVDDGGSAGRLATDHRLHPAAWERERAAADPAQEGDDD